jgi:Zn finger protein HypA/HybF involved in hydrogenase expression
MSLAEGAAELIESTAIGLARTHRLEVEGTIWCWNCSERAALMPSLHCPQCLAAVYIRKGIVAPLCVNRAQTEADVAAARI